jgi:hypothetical protein
MTHVWQEQHGDPSTTRGVDASYDWTDSVRTGTPWENLGVEQQAALLPRAYDYEQRLKEWEASRNRVDDRPPLPKELEKLHRPGTWPEPPRPTVFVGTGLTGLQDVGGYFLEALRKVRRGFGAPR